MRLLGAVFPNTDAGTIDGAKKLPATSAALFLKKSLR
jgi:hypothetical protein